ncbi:hypothetical protein AB1399_08915, partial [Hydrogenibacillus schlegelii]|uniref:hypothetical protein n=1 Tax=Hydrogenibacillus schlegelii TaxID=1484 RepID=UPI00349FE6B8
FGDAGVLEKRGLGGPVTRRGGSGVPFARSQFKRTFSSDIRRREAAVLFCGRRSVDGRFVFLRRFADGGSEGTFGRFPAGRLRIKRVTINLFFTGWTI